jgi:hypothetical protein
VNEELKPCPKCHSDERLFITGVVSFRVECLNRNNGYGGFAVCSAGPHKETREEAIAAWNRRTEPKGVGNDA